MAYQFSDEDKKEVSNNYFQEGVHKVGIDSAEMGKDAKDQIYLELSIEGEEGQEAKTKLYFTEKAGKFSFNTLRNVFVHNTPEKDKEAMRKAFDAIKDTDELAKKVSKLVGMEGWFMVYKDGSTYVGSDGTNKEGYRRNFYGYEPTMPKVQQNNTAKAVMDGGEDVQASEFPF